MKLISILGLAAMTLTSASALAADYPAPGHGDWVAHDFKFHTGEVTPELKLHYTTVGDPKGEAVLVLHGTTGSGDGMLNPSFAGQLFGPGQPLDATKYYIILPDAIGHGQTSKPSDGLKARFPKYDYDDMVDAQYRLLTEGLGIRHVRLVTGVSMGGMNTWVWGERYPDFMDALVPMASQPTAMASRNWMLRRMLIETIRNDPGYMDGNYTSQPPVMKYASTFYGLATAGGTLHLQKLAPTRELADKMVDERLAAPSNADANDFIWQVNASRNYDPEPMLGKIRAHVLAINSADDERDPPETGVMDAAMKKVKNGRVYLIPATTETFGHGTVFNATLYAKQLGEFLAAVPGQIADHRTRD